MENPFVSYNLAGEHEPFFTNPAFPSAGPVRWGDLEGPDLGAPPSRDGARPATPPRSLPLVLGRKVCSSLESEAQVEHGTIKIAAKQVNGLGQFGVGDASQIPIDYALIVGNEAFHALAKPHEFETARM